MLRVLWLQENAMCIKMHLFLKYNIEGNCQNQIGCLCYPVFLCKCFLLCMLCYIVIKQITFCIYDPDGT